ncbi:hypothetical protein [Sporomusa sp. KB1]|jgi:hypothetical protein|nr:hypothetical protein [Sporomusa sp. KB1]TWH49283.1 hypothetical protein Salpa_5493 [Sporomusa sp. KB1]
MANINDVSEEGMQIVHAPLAWRTPCPSIFLGQNKSFVNTHEAMILFFS